MSTIKNPAFFPELDSIIPCDQCGNEIVYVGPHWDHVPIEGAKPRHVATLPDRFNHFFEPEMLKGERGGSDPEPGSKDICLHCDSYIIYVGPHWEHTGSGYGQLWRF